MTYAETYEPAMHVQTQAEADALFARLVEDVMSRWNQTRGEAQALVRADLGYYAGYYDQETRERVERLFRCAHPIFGAIAENGAPTAKEALETGQQIALRMGKRR